MVKVNCKDAILRTYCTDNVALFIGHEKKDDKTLSEAKEENEDKTKTNYYENEEKSFINDLIKYKRNYLL